MSGQTQPVLHQPLARQDAERVAHVLKAISDPTRLQLLSMISNAPGGEACVVDLAEPLGLRPPTVSHHLKVLIDVGLLRREKRGIWAWYSLIPERLAAVRDLLT